MNLNELTLTEAKKGLKEKKFSSVELTRACLDRMKKLEPKLNAFVTVTEKVALDRAKQADVLLGTKEETSLLGIPMAIKDNFSTKNIKTTASSNVLKEYIPPYNATVVQKLEDAG